MDNHGTFEIWYLHPSKYKHANKQILSVSTCNGKNICHSAKHELMDVDINTLLWLRACAQTFHRVHRQRICSNKNYKHIPKLYTTCMYSVSLSRPGRRRSAEMSLFSNHGKDPPCHSLGGVGASHFVGCFGFSLQNCFCTLQNGSSMNLAFYKMVLFCHCILLM